MCGRYTLSLSVDEIWDELELDGEPGADIWSQGPQGVEDGITPRFNIAPTQAVPVVTDKSPKKLVMLRWGLVPFWAKDVKIGARMLNARAESLADKPAFKDSFQRRRCLVLADGFYEWHREGEGKKATKTPMYARRPGAGLITFAGLWASWHSKEEPDQRVISCTIVTTDAAGVMTDVHHRMPVIIEPDARADWLDRGASVEDLGPLLKPHDADLEVYAIRTLVNSVKNDGPELIVPADASASEPERILD